MTTLPPQDTLEKTIPATYTSPAQLPNQLTNHPTLLNRQHELKYLENRYNRPNAEFAVIYGRCRMGKTTLVYEWSLNKPHLYFFATHLPSEVLLRESFQKIAAATQMTLAAAQHYLNDLHTIGVVGASPIANPSA